MKLVKENSGYTLIEMIITIALIAVAVGLSGFGLSVIYNNNVNTGASNIVNDIKLVQSREMASNNNNYKLIIGVSGSNYEVKILQGIGGPPNAVYKKYELANSMILKKEIGGTFVDVSTLAEADLSFEFDVSTGKVIDYPTGDASNPFTSGAGRYELSSSSSNRVIEFVVIKQNGRVYIDD